MLTKNERFYKIKEQLEKKVADCDLSEVQLPAAVKEFINKKCIYELHDIEKNTYIFYAGTMDVRPNVIRKIFHIDGKELSYQYALMYYSEALNLIFYQDLPHEDVVYVEVYQQKEAFRYRLNTLSIAQECGGADERVRNEPPMFSFGDLFYG